MLGNTDEGAAVYNYKISLILFVLILLQICDISARIAALKNAGLNVDTQQSRITKTRIIPVMVPEYINIHLVMRV